MKSKECKCPVCGKAGISDYKKENVICPQCNTDLSIYKTIATNNWSYKIWQMLSGISVLVIAGLLLFRGKSGRNYEKESQLQDSIVIMRSQVNLLTSQMDSLKNMKAEKAEEQYYVVKAGDSFSKISYTLYHTEKYASEIASINGLSLKKVIHPEMKLKVPSK